MKKNLITNFIIMFFLMSANAMQYQRETSEQMMAKIAYLSHQLEIELKAAMSRNHQERLRLKKILKKSNAHKKKLELREEQSGFDSCVLW